jgi:hypothetical protein
MSFYLLAIVSKLVIKRSRIMILVVFLSRVLVELFNPSNIYWSNRYSLLDNENKTFPTFFLVLEILWGRGHRFL